MIYRTEDGSHSLRSERFGGASYHSRHGAIRESRHIFIEAGLLPLVGRRSAGDEVAILELGFGSGLNALLTRRVGREYPKITFDYQTFETFPLGPEEAALLNYPTLLGIDSRRLAELHEAEWSVRHRMDDNFLFTKHKADILTVNLAPGATDIIYYDAFAPEVQPELWTPEALARAYTTLRRPGGCLLTYCARGQFKRDLRSLGFGVESLPGPPGKREMTRATIR